VADLCRICRAPKPEGWSPHTVRCNRCAYEETLRRDYKLTLEDYARLALSQDFKCALCQGALRFDKFTAVDHCHESGRVRGLLCTGCNSALGALGDTPEALKRALAYVSPPPQRPCRACGEDNRSPRGDCRSCATRQHAAWRARKKAHTANIQTESVQA
jgi:hypothetical protein